MIEENQIIEVFTLVDDFILGLNKEQSKLIPSKRKRGFPSALSESEVITICLLFQFSGFRNFKAFYTGYVQKFLKPYFPKLLSYNRFVELKKSSAPQILIFLHSLMQSNICTGISVVDSSPIVVCNNKRISRHKTFKGLAKRGKSTMGWFFGFKVHIVISHKGELLSFTITPGNVHDTKPVEGLAENIFAKLFGDKGYISQKLFEKLMSKGVQVITNLKSNMKNKFVPLFDKLLLRKRYIVETAFGILKEEFHFEHSRHRSPKNFVVNLLSALTAYCLRPRKPSIRL